MIKTINVDVPTTEWPKTLYSNAGCKTGRSKLLYEHSYVMKLKDELAQLKGSARSDNPTPRKRLKKRRRGKGNNNNNDTQPSLDSTPVMELEMEEVLFANDNEVGGGGAPKIKRKKKRKNRRKFGKGKGSEQRTLSTAEKDDIPACFACPAKHLGLCRHHQRDP
ncbi:MAG: hypothetical protein GY822_31945, partial [Deltaproteobacteria bacterium]|nr:hypothetical protein [Deltaproteobacteria bacterium]